MKGCLAGKPLLSPTQNMQVEETKCTSTNYGLKSNQDDCIGWEAIDYGKLRVRVMGNSD